MPKLILPFLLAACVLPHLALAQGTDKAQPKRQLKPFVPPPLAWPPAPRPTDEQMREAYEFSTKKILAMAKYPPSTQLMPIEKSWFVTLAGCGKKRFLAKSGL